MIVDTSALLAYFDLDEPDHLAVAGVIDEAPGALVVSPYVVAEVDYLIGSRLGGQAEVRALAELAGGAWDIVSFGVEDLVRARLVVEPYADQAIDVADASNVVLAARHGTRTIVTLDRRHFGVLRPLDGGRFTILP